MKATAPPRQQTLSPTRVSPGAPPRRSALVSAKPARIGIDFDNTIVNYDAVFAAAARQRGLLAQTFAGGKQAVREAIRRLPDGERAWQSLQGHVYGAGIGGAVMFEGLDRFLRRCRAEGVDVSIVSHKTEYGHFDDSRTNLREAARGWMAAQGFFDRNGFGIDPGNVYFESTRAEKIKRIAELGCSHFVDDLADVLDDPAFPDGVVAMLFAEGMTSSGKVRAYAELARHHRGIVRMMLAADTTEDVATIGTALVGWRVDAADPRARRRQQPHLPARPAKAAQRR